MRKKKAWYPLGKTLAERRAWELWEEQKSYRMVVMNPTLIFGPMLQPTLNTSSAAILSYMNGAKKRIENSAKTVVDVRDVALAHVLGYENKSANGRYLLIAESAKFSDIVKTIKDSLKAMDKNEHAKRVPTEVAKDFPGVGFGAPPPHHTLFDCTKATQGLGLKFRKMEEMVKETVHSLFEHALIE
mmetsp:Transcript_18664/g.26005  ORF Transcript_18664/g.26005 Transcript_18664/m.26005 type:complete len:186 (+) Transcript_18664:3-560(+)